MTDARDDDALDELPPLGSALDEEEPVGVDDFDAATQLETGDEEDIGLDDSTAGADVYDVAELLGETATDDEGERWTADTDAAGDMVGDDGLDGESDGEEYGWTLDTEAPSLEGWDEDLIDEPEGSMLGADAGEEGVEEDFSVRGDEDDVELPPIAVGAEGDELADDLDLQEEAEIEGVELSFEEEARMSGGTLPDAMPPAQLGVAHLGPSDDALAAVALAGDTLFAGGEQLYARGEAGLQAMDPLGLDSQDVTSIAIDRWDPVRLVVGTRLAGALRSVDGGRSFVPVNGWLHGDPGRLSVAFFVAGEPHAGGVRLWGRTRAGALYRSEDLGTSWSSPLLPAPVAALGVADAGGVVALCVPRVGTARVAISGDGGHSWTMREVTGLAGVAAIPDADHHVAVLGSTLVTVREGEAEGPFVSRDAGATWERLGRLPSAGPVLLVDEGGGPVLYAALFFDGADRGVVVREPLDTPERAAMILDVRRERDERRIEGRGDPEGDNRALALAARVRGPRTQLYAATGAGLFRVDVKPEG